MSVILADGLRVRAPTLDDLDAVYELANIWSVAIHGEPDYTRDDIALGWRDPEFSLADDAWVIESLDGQAVGYGEVWQSHRVQFGIHLFSHPEFPREAIEAELVEMAEVRVRARLHEAPPHARVSLRNWLAANDSVRRRVFAHAGFTPVRRFWRMRVDMGAAPPATVWPEGITVHTMMPGEEPAVHAALNDAFEDHWGHLPMAFETWRAFFLDRTGFDPALCFLAKDGDQIAGLSLCRPEVGIGWVDDLGVRRPWRRRGLALALLLHSFGEFYRRGQHSVGLNVDAQSLTGATRLYEKAGMRVVRESEVFEKELRPGVELSTQALE